MTVLYCGNCERLKAGVHGLALATAALCGAYNLAAWLVRRQRHLAINAVFYSAAVFWESKHVRHHLSAILMAHPEPVVAPKPVVAPASVVAPESAGAIEDVIAAA
jgi:hypothetical protein